MQLERVRIQHYKCLEDVDVTFRSPAGEKGVFTHFLVGVNGSGKSCFLEAPGLTFACVMQGQAPGFPFALEYRVRQTRIEVEPAGGGTGKGLKVTVHDGGDSSPLEQVPAEYLPRRIVAFSSGDNHLMESALLSSPQASLVRDLYDLAGRGGADSEMEISRVLELYRRLDTDPRVFSVDGTTARLVVPALFAVVPHFAERETAESYFRLRDELVRRIGGGFRPAAFSVTVDEALLRRALENRRNSPQYGLLAKLLRPEQPDGSGPLHAWAVRRPIFPPADALQEEREDREEGEARQEKEPRMSQTAVFPYEPWGDRQKDGWMWSPALSEEFDGDPMLLFNVLLAARRGNILRDVQLAFHGGERGELLGLEALSEGELMWLARMGLALMSRRSRSAGTLFLFDEPDIHFNSEWNMDFIKILRQCGETPAGALEQEFVIATHSTLLLTDAYPEQISLFSAVEGEGVRVEETPVSPFAAQQDELASRLFSASAIGSYARDRVDTLMERAQTPEEILELIEKTGPGYQRFRLYERYHELRRQQR